MAAKSQWACFARPSTRGSRGEQMLKPLPVKQEKWTGTRPMHESARRGTGCGDATTSGEAKRHRQTNCTRANRCSSPFQRKAVLPRWQYLRHRKLNYLRVRKNWFGLRGTGEWFCIIQSTPFSRTYDSSCGHQERFADL